MKTILGLKLSDICSDGTSLYECDSALSEAVDALSLHAGFSRNTKVAIPKRAGTRFLETLKPYLNPLGVTPIIDPFAKNYEVVSRWARSDKHGNGSGTIDLATVVDAYLSKELLRLRVFLGSANKESAESAQIICGGLAMLFDNCSKVRIPYSQQTGIVAIAPAHELPIVLEAEKALGKEVVKSLVSTNHKTPAKSIFGTDRKETYVLVPVKD